jgi:hypothetical protein
VLDFIYIGSKNQHASNVPLIDNPTTTYVTPQFHVVCDEGFTSLLPISDSKHTQIMSHLLDKASWMWAERYNKEMISAPLMVFGMTFHHQKYNTIDARKTNHNKAIIIAKMHLQPSYQHQILYKTLYTQLYQLQLSQMVHLPLYPLHILTRGLPMLYQLQHPV